MQIDPVIIHMPDFDDRVADRFSRHSKNATREMGNLSRGMCSGIVHDQKVVIGVHGQPVRVEGPLCLPWGQNAVFSKCPGSFEGDGSKQKTPEKLPTTLRAGCDYVSAARTQKSDT